MTRKELLKKAIAFEPVPRVPVVTMSGATWALKQAGLSPETLLQQPDAGAQVILDTCDRLNVDIVYGGRAIPHIILRAMGGVLNNSRIGLPGEIVKKPLQDIEEIYNWTPEQVMENLRADKEYQLLLKQTQIIREKTGEERFVGVGSFGPFTTAGQIIGVQELLTNLFDEDYEEDIDALMKFSEEVVYQVILDFLKAGGNLIFIAEPVSSGDLISEADFEKWALPHLVNIRNRLENETPYMILHICGSTKERIPALADSGISVFSLDALDIHEALDLAGGKITIMGNLNPVRILERKTEQEVHEQATALCKAAGKNGGFLLAPGCDLTPDTTYENIHAMVQAAFESETI